MDKDWTDKEGNVIGEDQPDKATDAYRAWRKQEINTLLADGEKANPTNHSTILTNPAHAEKALAYDVAIGVCELSEEEINDLRREADWRFLDWLDKDHPSRKFQEYFETGYMSKKSLSDWIAQTPETQRPEGIQDHRDGGFLLKILRHFL